MKLSDIRAVFCDFFVKNGHILKESSPLVPQNDPTLLFANAGMVQFKDFFLGNIKPGKKPFVSSQKCMRAGGKHNDLENVGHTARHHTFFEMLGNFSFGSYFKERAIELAWKLITEEMQIDKKKLYITVYKKDEEAFDLWKKITGFSNSKIIQISSDDNFWAMGNTGPCGPCTEIFFDHGDKVAGGLPGTKDEDGDRYMEIWNLVFTQYDRMEDGKLNDIPVPCIDTGMGLERITSVLQGVHNNYDIDLFKALIESIKEITGSKKTEIAHKVIADHLRATSFLLADGVMPSNEGRGYVLRRIVRRAMRYANKIGYKKPLLHKLVPLLIELMGDYYKELTMSEKIIESILKTEEENFNDALERGLRILHDLADKTKKKVIPGAEIFTLYDTHGFPVDLAEDVLKSYGKTIDHKGFEEKMSEQKQRAKSAWAGSGDVKTDGVWFKVRAEVGNTEFVGYDEEYSTAYIKSMVRAGELVISCNVDDEIKIILDNTPFYGESGGQIGDKGFILYGYEQEAIEEMISEFEGTDNSEFYKFMEKKFETLRSNKTGILEVLDTQKCVNDLYVHICKVRQGHEIHPGTEVVAVVNANLRDAIKRNHSATHLLHYCLRSVLGEHVAQKGSLVSEKHLRFDFNHFQRITEEELLKVERMVNSMIMENDMVDIDIMKKEKAIDMGAMALFGEKYEDKVRAVAMGNSFELCGGTHVEMTGDIGMLKIIKEGSVAAGVRRIEAVTGFGTMEFIEKNDFLLHHICGILKVPQDEVCGKLESLLGDNRDLKRQIETIHKAKLKSELSKEKLSNGMSFFNGVFSGVSVKDIKQIADEIRVEKAPSLVAIVLKDNDKICLVIGVSEEEAKKLKASDIAAKVAHSFNGSVKGGRADVALVIGDKMKDGVKDKDLKNIIQDIKKFINN